MSFVKRLTVLGLVIVSAIVLVAPSGSAADQGGDMTFHFRSTGEFASASWTTAPDVPAVGDRWIETFVVAGEVARNLDSPERETGSFVFMSQQRCVRRSPLSTYCFQNFSGFADPAFSDPVDVQIDPALRTASVSGRFSFAELCSRDFVCEDFSGHGFEASWEATGRRTTSAPGRSCEGGGIRFVHRGVETSRPAVATATIEGLEIPGPLQQAAISSSLTVEVSVGDAFCF